MATKVPDWVVPDPLSTIEVELDADASTVVRRFGNPSGQRLLLSHGNGLAIDMYYPFWSLLEDAFDVMVFDMRNHGWNQVSSPDGHNVYSFVTDMDRVLRALRDRFGDKPVVGVFHSLSALTALLLSTDLVAPTYEAKGSGFAGLVLFDPPLVKPGKNQLEFDAASETTARRARNRTESFESIDQYVELLKFIPGYLRVVEGAHELVAETTLRQSEDQKGYQLRCPREYEARVIDYIHAYAGQVNFDAMPCPTKVIGSDPVLPYSYLPTVDLSDMLSIEFDFIPDSTHLLQIEYPDKCAQYVREFVVKLEAESGL